jgi:hypothetical protein
MGYFERAIAVSHGSLLNEFPDSSGDSGKVLVPVVFGQFEIPGSSYVRTPKPMKAVGLIRNWLVFLEERVNEPPIIRVDR